MEISPAYIDVAVERWQADTGKDAILDGDGRTFAAGRAPGRGRGELGSIMLLLLPQVPVLLFLKVGLSF